MTAMNQTRTWTVLELINWSKGYLEEKGFDNARLEVELLLGHTLRLPRIELYLQFGRQLRESELAEFKAAFWCRMVPNCCLLAAFWRSRWGTGRPSGSRRCWRSGWATPGCTGTTPAATAS